MGYIGAIVTLTLSIIVATSVLIPTVQGLNTDSYTAGEVLLLGTITTITIMGLVYSVATAFGMV